MKKIMSLFLSAAMVLGLSGCGSMNNTTKMGLGGAGGGAAIGAIIGGLIGHGKGAAIGAAVGAAAGGTAGVLIGKKMDKQAKELAQINGAQVDTITDQNNLTGIRVTFDSGILFGFNKTNLSESAKKSLSQFASSLRNNPETDVTILGYTDNVGTRAANEKVSTQRAANVKTYLNQSGVSSTRMQSKGMGWENPVANNDTEAGRAQNRRVEIYITANETMVKQAADGTLQ